MGATRIAVDIERLTRRTDLSAETAAAILGSAHTRTTLHVLSTADPPCSLDELAAGVAGDTDLTRSSARITLVHTTLPKLEDRDLLDYELRGETVHLSGPVVDLEEPIGASVGGNDLESIEFGDW